jgi:hypothetical protein
MKVTSVTVIHCLGWDKVVVETDILNPNGLGPMTLNAELKPGSGEQWVRDIFGEVKIDIIDRRNERG